MQVLRCELGLRLLLAGDLLLFEFLHFQFELVEVECAFLFRPVQLLAMELLEAAVLFDALLQVRLVLRRYVLNLLVEALDLNLRDRQLLLQLFGLRVVVGLRFRLGWV